MASEVDVVIVGAGLSGIACARELHLQGVSVRVLEIAAKLGGTWHSTRFPGIRADSLHMHIQNLLSWHPVPSDSITTGQWLQSYLEECADASGIAGLIRFNTRVESAEWDSAASVWRVRSTTDGSQRLTMARFVVSCSGYFDLQRPHVPTQLRGPRRASPGALCSLPRCARRTPRHWPASGSLWWDRGDCDNASTGAAAQVRRADLGVPHARAHRALFRLPGPWAAVRLVRLHHSQLGWLKLRPALRHLPSQW
jgi:2-polyprenyl-6-methoxyphenol hydroxylase-like FAD-dependent oxidoreductase